VVTFNFNKGNPTALTGLSSEMQRDFSNWLYERGWGDKKAKFLSKNV